MGRLLLLLFSPHRDDTGTPSPPERSVWTEQPSVVQELRWFSRHRRLAEHSILLARLADSVETGVGLTAWAGGDLVAAYGGTDAIGPDDERSARRGRRLAGLPTVVVFLPLILTWIGIGLAAYAYERMLSDPAQSASGSFLELWQQGFGGRLWPFLRFDMMVLYTVAALLAVVGTMLATQRWERAEQAERDRLGRRLAGVLAQTQAIAAYQARSEPRESAKALYESAQQLREMIAQSVTAVDRTSELLSHAVEAAEASSATVERLQTAVITLQESVQAVETASRSSMEASTVLSSGADRLGEAVTEAATLLRNDVTQASRRAGAQIEAGGRAAAEHFDQALAEAVTLLREQAEATVRWTHESRSAITETTTAARESAESASATLGSAAQRLDEAVTDLPKRLAAAAEEGSERIGAAYDLALAATAFSLRDEARDASGALQTRIGHLDAVLSEQTRAQQRSLDAYQQAMSDHLDELRGTMDRIAGLVKGALERIPKSPELPEVADPEAPAQADLPSSPGPFPGEGTTEPRPAEPQEPEPQDIEPRTASDGPAEDLG